jgi:hypothetical protein
MPRWAVTGSDHELGTDKFVADRQQLLPDQLDERHRAAPVGLRVRRDIQPPLALHRCAQLATDLSRLLHHPGVESTAILGNSNGGTQ